MVRSVMVCPEPSSYLTCLRAPLSLDGKKMTHQDKSHDGRRLTQCPTMMSTERGTQSCQRVCMGSRGSLGENLSDEALGSILAPARPTGKGRERRQSSHSGPQPRRLPVQAGAQTKHTHQAVTYRLWEAREALKPQVGARKATSGRSTDLRPTCC